MNRGLIDYTVTKMMEVDKNPATITYTPKKDNTGMSLNIEGNPPAVLAGIMRVCVVIARMYGFSFSELLELLKLNYNNTPLWEEEVK